MKISLEEIKKVANQGPFYPDWDSLATYQVAQLVQRSQVWDFYPLGAL